MVNPGWSFWKVGNYGGVGMGDGGHAPPPNFFEGGLSMALIPKTRHTYEILFILMNSTRGS